MIKIGHKLTLMDMIFEYLLEHLEGATARELRKELGGKPEGLVLALNAMVDVTGELIKAHEQRPVKVAWDIRTDFPELGKAPEVKHVNHVSHDDIYRLSPDKWIEMVS